MTQEIKNRLEQIRAGRVPEGYIKTRAGIMPTDWSINKRAKEVFNSHTDKKHSGDREILASTQEKGIVPRSQMDIDIKCSEEGIRGYKKVDAGDYVISLRSFQGGIEYSPYNGIVSPAYTVLKPIVEIADEYYKNYFKTESFIKRLNSAVYGIRDGKQIGYKDYGDLIIHNPPLPEQKKIGEILIQCDKRIKLQQRKIEEIKRLRIICLNKMFPKKGSNVPEIRFPGFTGPWKQCKLGEIARLKGRIGFRGYTEKDIVSKNEGGVLTFSPTNIVDNKLTTVCKNTYITRLKYDESPEIKVHNGDILFVKTGSTLGKSALITGLSEDATLNPQVVVMRVQLGEEKFFSAVLTTEMISQQVNAAKIGGAVPTLTETQIKNFHIAIPVSQKEKYRIGQYFDHLNRVITLHEKELQEMQKLKKALMQLLLTGIVRVKV